MALVNQPNSPKSSKKWITLAALVGVIAIVIWQASSLFGGSAEDVPPPLSQPPQNSIVQPTNGQPPSNIPGTPPANLNPPPPSRAASAPTSGAVVKTNELKLNDKILKIQNEIEDKYIDQVNKLQFLKIQREIEETNQAIAAARLATVTAEKNASELLTAPTAPTSMIPAGAYGSSLVNPAPSGSLVVNSTTNASTSQPVNPPPPALTEVSYVVISVTMQLGHWNAILGYQGKLFNVAVGDILPVDGSVVAAINKNGVTLMKDGKPKKISINTSI